MIACLPASGYVDTLRIMIVNQSDESYNFGMVMIIKIAQLMKILYYFYHQYATVVFGQAITVFSSALLLTFLKFKYSKDRQTERLCTFPGISHILNIRNTLTFFEHIIVLTIYLGIIFLLFLTGFAIFGRTPAVDFLGLLGNLLDTTISFPLFVQIVIHRNVNSVSPVLVTQYILGDLMKVVTFLFVATPWVFVFGAYCQCCVDGVMSLTYFHLARSRWKQVGQEEGVPSDRTDADV
jgi:hypothetical protein